MPPKPVDDDDDYGYDEVTPVDLPKIIVDPIIVVDPQEPEDDDFVPPTLDCFQFKWPVETNFIDVDFTITPTWEDRCYMRQSMY